MKVLDLFSGIGGFALGFHMADPKFKTVGFVEQDEYCQKILALRFPEVPIYNDIKTFDPTEFIGTDIVCGGFPCQPWSQAGRQRGAKDDRDLWKEMLRVIKAVRPRFVVGENVRGFINEPLGLQRSVSDLENIGYENQAFIIPALAVDAKHRRDRMFLMAVARHGSWRHIGATKKGRKHSRERATDTNQTSRSSKQPSAVANPDSGDKGRKVRGLACTDATKDRPKKQYKNQAKRLRDCSQDVADTTSQRMERRGATGKQKPQASSEERLSGRHSAGSWPSDWPVEPELGRVATGIPNRVDRLKCIGNSIVPHIAMHIGRAIIEASR